MGIVEEKMIKKLYKTSKHKNVGPMKGELASLVWWKQEPDKFQDSDNYSGMGDQNEGWNEFGEQPALTGSPKDVKFIKKDETNAEAMKRMRMKRWF